MIVKDGKSKYPSLLRVCKNEQENQAYIRKNNKIVEYTRQNSVVFIEYIRKKCKKSSFSDIIHNDVCKDNNLLISIVQDGPYPKGRRPFIARDGSRFQNDRGRQTEIILVLVYMILYFMCSPTARTWEGVRAFRP
mgnify:FL=1